MWDELRDIYVRTLRIRVRLIQMIGSTDQSNCRHVRYGTSINILFISDRIQKKEIFFFVIRNPQDYSKVQGKKLFQLTFVYYESAIKHFLCKRVYVRGQRVLEKTQLTRARSEKTRARHDSVVSVCQLEYTNGEKE